VPAAVAGVDNPAMMGKSVEKRCGHLGIADGISHFKGLEK
jgi:hypothetical protein